MNIVITGASSGLGAAIARATSNYSNVYDWSINAGVDVRSRTSIGHAVGSAPDKVDVLINAAGVNGIDYLPDVAEAEWDRIMDTNAKGIFLVTQALLPKLRDGTVLNIVSNAAHIPMTSSLAYNASKGAAEIMTKQLARELIKTHNITVFGISPNKMAGTAMSRVIERRVCALRGWTPEEANKYQLAALPAGEETDVETLAEFIAFLLSNKQRHKFFAGCIIPYGGP